MQRLHDNSFHTDRLTVQRQIVPTVPRPFTLASVPQVFNRLLAIIDTRVYIGPEHPDNYAIDICLAVFQLLFTEFAEREHVALFRYILRHEARCLIQFFRGGHEGNTQVHEGGRNRATTPDLVYYHIVKPKISKTTSLTQLVVHTIGNLYRLPTVNDTNIGAAFTRVATLFLRDFVPEPAWRPRTALLDSEYIRGLILAVNNERPRAHTCCVVL